MHLRYYQQEAFNSCITHYNKGEQSAFLIMPTGSGKSITTICILKELSKNHNVKSILYFACNKLISDQFKAQISMIEPEVSNNIEIDFSIYDDAKVCGFDIWCKKYQLIVFDDFSKHTSLVGRFIENYPSLFLGLSNSLLTGVYSSIISNNIVYSYTPKQLIIDGYALSKKVEYHQVIGRAVRNDIINYPSINDYVVDLENSNNELSEIMSLISSGELEISELKRLGQKKEQLKHFYNLLNNNEYFSSFVVDSRRPESVWQKFFEENKWIFGFGLNYVFNTSLEGKKLEQVVEGYSISNNGKRIDALMHSNGLIQSLCFAEIKTHLKPTLRKSEYRPGVWSISDELTGGVAQVQRTVQQSINNLQTGLMVKDENGYSTGGKLFLYNPKAFLIIGSLAEFKDSEGRVHEGKFSSFQLFRRSISDVEIITFDELYERAHALVNNTCL